MSFYVSTATFFLLHCDKWDRVVALPRHKFVTRATLLQLEGNVRQTWLHFHINQNVWKIKTFSLNFTKISYWKLHDQIIYFLHLSCHIFFTIKFVTKFFLKKHSLPPLKVKWSFPNQSYYLIEPHLKLSCFDYYRKLYEILTKKILQSSCKI